MNSGVAIFVARAQPFFRVEIPSVPHVSLGYAFSFSSGDLYGNKSPWLGLQKVFWGLR